MGVLYSFITYRGNNKTDIRILSFTILSVNDNRDKERVVFFLCVEKAQS